MVEIIIHLNILRRELTCIIRKSLTTTLYLLNYINSIMENQQITNPFKVIKMDNGEDVVCKIITEYKDAFIVERPMAITENQQYHEELGEIVCQTGLARWMNFTNDIHFLIAKRKILSMANLAPEVSFYYKNICEKLTVAEKSQLKTEEEVVDKMKQLKGNLEDLVSDILNFFRNFLTLLLILNPAVYSQVKGL